MLLNIKYSHLIVAFIAMGFSSMISQVVLLRELVLFFTGNELTLGIILGLWLLGTAAGSGLIGRCAKYFSYPIKLLIICQLLLVVLLPLSMIFIRVSKAIFSIPVGEITNPAFILMVPLLALAPICIIVGFLYTLGCKLLAPLQKNHPTVPGHVFLFEAIGSGAAGFMASIALFRFLENFQIVTLICVFNLMVAIFIWNSVKSKIIGLLIPTALVLMITMIVFFPELDHFSNKKRWEHFQLLQSKTSIYGNVSVTRLGESTSFYENGVLMFTTPDLMSAEESVHFALLEHPHPQKVLLIGGDAAGSIPQIVSHPDIKQVDFILIDPTVIQLSQKYLPTLNELLKDDRIKIYYQDGRLFLKQAETKYDVIIVNLPDPQTALINRFYTLEFYRSIHNNLAPDGILSFSITSSENVLSLEQTVFLNCLYYTMKQVFADIILIPGNSIHFVGCLSANILTGEPQVLVQRLQQRRLPTIYVREYYIPFRMTQDRMNYITEKVANDERNILNRDFRPIGYFYNTILWLTYFRIDLQAIYHVLDHFNLYVIIAMLVTFLIPIIIGVIHSRSKQPDLNWHIFLAIMVIGFSTISLEVLIILGFQAIYGYAYYQLSLIISGFMVGLTLGSWCALRRLKHFRLKISDFIKMQVLLMLYPLMTLFILVLLSKIIIPSMAIQLIFLLLIVGAGMIGGYQFPLANHLILQRGQRVENVGGVLYAADLLGSVVGALIMSTLLIPLLGLGSSCFALSILNSGIVITLMLNRYLSHQ